MPCGPINDLEQVFAEPQAVARGLQIELPHPTRGQGVAGAQPDALLGDAAWSTACRRPLLGQHTDEVLRDLLGKSEAEIARLRSEGIV